MSPLPLYLASASPRRRALLQQLGLDPRVELAEVDEGARAGEPPEEQVLRLAEAKGRAVASRIDRARPGLLLAADTAVVVDGACLGKPPGAPEAAAMLRLLRGRRHQVHTGVFLMRTDSGQSLCRVDTTTVHFRSFDDATVQAYVATGEGRDKAGGYGIQGCGVLLVERIEGSWSNVVGLPLERLPGWLAHLGIDVWQLTVSPDGAA